MCAIKHAVHAPVNGNGTAVKIVRANKPMFSISGEIVLCFFLPCFFRTLFTFFMYLLFFANFSIQLKIKNAKGITIKFDKVEKRKEKIGVYPLDIKRGMAPLSSEIGAIAKRNPAASVFTVIVLFLTEQCC